MFFSSKIQGKIVHIGLKLPLRALNNYLHLPFSMTNRANLNRRAFLKRSAASLAAIPLISGVLQAADKKTPRTILLISGWQDINIGDITHTNGMLNILESYFPDTKIVLWKSNMISADDPAIKMTVKHFPKIEIIGGSVNKTDFEVKSEKILRAFDDSDVFIHGSGPSVVRWDALRAWMKYTKKPFGIFGTTIQSVSPQLKPALENASFLYTRETASLEVLKKHGIHGDHVAFVPDATFHLHTKDDNTAIEFLRERKLENRKFICVVPRLRWTPYPGRLEREPEKHLTNEKWKEIDHAKAREAIITWVEKTQLPVLICPEMTYQVDIMDELLIAPLPEKIKPFVQKRGYWMPDEAASLYARAHTVLSFECHSPIIATAMGTPAFYLRQPEDTIKGQMYYDLGMNDWTFEIEKTTGKQISDRLIEVTKNYPLALEKVEKTNELTKSIYTEAVKRIDV